MLFLSLASTVLLAAPVAAPPPPPSAATPTTSTTTTPPPTTTTTLEPTAPAVAAGCVAPTKERRILRVAVREMQVPDAKDARLARLVTESIVIEVRKLQGVSVTSLDEVKLLLDLQAEKQLLGCEQDSCLAEIVEALGVDALIIGELARVGDERVFGLKLVDERQGGAVAQVSQRLTIERGAEGEESLAMVGPAIEQLLPALPLRVGLTRGVDPEQTLRLNPPPLPPWVVGVGGAASGAAVVVAGGAGLVYWQAYQTRVELNDTGSGSATVVQAQQDTADNAVIVAASAVTAAVVLGAITGVAALFTDWAGYADDADDADDQAL